MNNKKVNIYDRLKKTFQSQKLTILVTSSSRYAFYNDYLRCFGEHEIFYFCPLGL